MIRLVNPKTCQYCHNANNATAANRTILICDKKQGCEDKFYVVAAGHVCGNWKGAGKRPAEPVDDNGTRYIPLTQGRFAVVDADDYEHLIKYKWSCQQDGNTFYAFRRVGRKRHRISMHRVIMKAPKGLIVDHIDGDGLNNRKNNLRLCTHTQNAWNKRPASDSYSRYKGITWHKDHKKWYVRICKFGRSMHLGSFDDEIEAASAYDKKAKELFGEYAYLNFPEK